MPSVRSALRTLAAVALVVGATACGSSGGNASPTTASAAPASTTTTTTQRKPHVPTHATQGFPSSDEAVNAFMDAWEHDRKPDLYRIADETAVVGVYRTPSGPPSQNRGCSEPVNPAVTTGGCSFLAAGEQGILQVSTEKRSIGWVVSAAVYERCNPCA